MENPYSPPATSEQFSDGRHLPREGRLTKTSFVLLAFASVVASLASNQLQWHFILTVSLVASAAICFLVELRGAPKMTQHVPLLLAPTVLATIVMIIETCSRSSLRIGIPDVPRYFAMVGYLLVAWFYVWISVRRSVAIVFSVSEASEPSVGRGAADRVFSDG